MFIQENGFENVVMIFAAILSCPQYVKYENGLENLIWKIFVILFRA